MANNYCKFNNIDKIDVLKMDVEGSEKRVVRQINRILIQRKVTEQSEC